MGYVNVLRNPKTTNERRMYYKSPELVRAKRNPLNIPTSWDDFQRCMQRCWKVQGKKRRQHGYDQKHLRKLKCDMKS